MVGGDICGGYWRHRGQLEHVVLDELDPTSLLVLEQFMAHVEELGMNVTPDRAQWMPAVNDCLA